MRLHLRELRERAPAGVVAPDAERRRQPRVLARLHVRVVQVPLAGVHHDAVADLDVRDLIADRPHDAARVRTHDVEVGGLAPPRLRLRDVDRDAARRPDVVEVHPCRHHQHQGVVRPQLGNVDDLVLDGLLGIAVAVGTHQLRVHLRRHLTQRRKLSDVVQVLGHGSHPFPVVTTNTVGRTLASREGSASSSSATRRRAASAGCPASVRAEVPNPCRPSPNPTRPCRRTPSSAGRTR